MATVTLHFAEGIAFHKCQHETAYARHKGTFGKATEDTRRTTMITRGALWKANHFRLTEAGFPARNPGHMLKIYDDLNWTGGESVPSCTLLCLPSSYRC